MANDMNAGGQDNKQRNMIIIVVVVIVLLCCCCFATGIGIYLWQNGDKLMQGLNPTSFLPALRSVV